MTTETIDIVIRENGARVVKRSIQSIGEVAENSVKGLRVLQNSLFVLGGAGLVSSLGRMIDTVTNFSNRLKLVTDSQKQLIAVQKEVFAISERTRSSFDSTAQVFTRTALAVKNLGISQAQTLKFTELLNKAVILSGAGVREAEAGLLQLSQGLASNTLQGDELRSVLENLPYVADIIAKHFGLTRGELRKFGAQGKISAKDILQAFKEAGDSIDKNFLKTVPTIGQAFEVLKTKLLQSLNRLNQFTGASAVAARAIIALANSLDYLIGGLVTAGAAFGSFKLGVFISRLSGRFTGLVSVISMATDALGALWVLFLANPFSIVIAAITSIISVLVLFSDKIGITSDGVVSLRDLFVAGFQIMLQTVSSFTNFFKSSFSDSFGFVSNLFGTFTDSFGGIWSNILQGTKTFINTQIALWGSLIRTIIRVWGVLPSALEDIGSLAINGLIDVVKTGIEKIIREIGKLLTFIGSAAEKVGLQNPFSGLLDNFTIDVDKYRPKITGAARKIGSIFNNELSSSLNKDYIGNAWSTVLERARKVATARTADLNKTSPATAVSVQGSKSGRGGGGGGKSLQDVIQDLRTQNQLLQVNSSERGRLQGVLKIENEIKRKLSTNEKDLVESLLHENDVLKTSAKIYESIHDPAYQYQVTLEALNMLLKQGRINQDEFSNSAIKARITFLNSQRDMASGMERGVLKLLAKTGDYATQMENIVTGAFDGMSKSIADLVVDGKADFSSLIKSIDKQIVQLVVSQAFKQLFGNAGIGGGGGAGGNMFSSLFSGIGKLFGFQTGGSFQVGSQTGIAPLHGTDNRLVAFRAQDGENVTVTPRGKQLSGNHQSVVVNFNITTPDVNGFKQSQSQLAAKAARMISQGRRNM